MCNQLSVEHMQPFHSVLCMMQLLYIYVEPGVPTVAATVSKDTAVIIKLTPAQTFDLIEQCQVSVHLATGSDDTRSTETVVDVNGNVLFLEGLLPGTEYSYRVAAMNGAGRSNFTEWVRFTTTATGEYRLTAIVLNWVTFLLGC